MDSGIEKMLQDISLRDAKAATVSAELIKPYTDLFEKTRSRAPHDSECPCQKQKI